MATRTENDKALVLEALLNEARDEADALRKEMERYRGIVLSTRLIMGHELKRPTSALMGYLDLMSENLEKSGDSHTFELAEKALSEVRLLNELNAFYLELLQVEGVGDAVGQAPIDAEPLVRETIKQLSTARQTTALVEVSVLNDVRPMLISGNALKLIVMNLVENALIYSQVQTAVRVELEEAEDKRGNASRRLLKLRVIDRGVGIPESYLKRIFSPFVRLRDDIAEGSGLGLTLVRSLVELNGGEVFIRSDVGKGTTVHVTLPINERHDNATGDQR